MIRGQLTVEETDDERWQVGQTYDVLLYGDGHYDFDNEQAAPPQPREEVLPDEPGGSFVNDAGVAPETPAEPPVTTPAEPETTAPPQE